MNQPLTVQQVHDIREYWAQCHSHEKTCAHFGLTYAQEHAINVIGRDYHLPDEVLATRLVDLDVKTLDPEMVAIAVLDDNQYVVYLERRNGQH